MGLEIYDFEFATPPDMKLIATLQAELKGQPVPVRSGIYHIPPTRENEPGLVSISFYYPQYQTPTPETPNWTLHFRSAGVGHTFSRSSPFVPTNALPRSTSTRRVGLGRLDDERDHEIMDYRNYADGTKDIPGYDFRYKFVIRLKKLESGEKLTEIKKEELPTIN